MKKVATEKPVPPVEITAEERYHMINDAAYFRAVKHLQETGKVEDPAESWCEVEAEIDAVLKRPHAG